jgi:cytochrome c5
MDFIVDCCRNFHRGNRLGKLGKHLQLPTTFGPLQIGGLRSMRYVLLLVFFVVALGGVFVGKSMGGQPYNIGPRSARELYAKNCASCHGKDGQAKTFKAKFSHARNLTDPEWQGRVSDERIFNSVMNGKGKMPAFGKKLSEQEINALVTYVRGLKK